MSECMWDGKSLLECTAYGNLFMVSKVENNKMQCFKVRKKKELLYITNEKKVYKHISEVRVGDLLFQDKSNNVAWLKPTGDFAESILKTAREVS